jgi:hypothetical protein
MRKPLPRTRALATAASTLALWGLLSPAPSSAQVQYTPVARTGQPAPGTAAGTTFDSITGTPVLDAQGRVAFYANLAGTGVSATNDSGLWGGPAGGLALVAREGDPAPGTPAGVAFGNLFGDPVIRDGRVSFLVFNSLTGAGVSAANDSGVWSGAPGGVQLIVREGDPAAGAAAGATYGEVQSNLIGGSNIGGASARLGAAGGNGLWVGPPGAVQPIALPGGPAPGTPAGVTFLSTAPQPLVLVNGPGRAVFSGTLAGSGVTTSNDSGIWAGGAGAVQLVAREGSQAAALPAGVLYGLISQSGFNDAGQVSLSGSVTGSGVTSANDSAIWTGQPGALQLLARKGDPAPGGPAGSTLNLSFTAAPLNRAGQAAFRAGLVGGGVTTANDTAIWTGTPGSLQMVAREGDPAPGTPAGVTFGDLGTSLTALNGSGQVAFRALLAGPGVDTSNDRGIFAGPPGALQLIAREGQTIDLGGGDLRTIADNGLFAYLNHGSEDGQHQSFNDAGQLAFLAQFTDGSRAILVATIPEPLGLAFAAAAGLLLLRRRGSPRTPGA